MPRHRPSVAAASLSVQRLGNVSKRRGATARATAPCSGQENGNVLAPLSGFPQGSQRIASVKIRAIRPSCRSTWLRPEAVLLNRRQPDSAKRMATSKPAILSSRAAARPPGRASGARRSLRPGKGPLKSLVEDLLVPSRDPRCRRRCSAEQDSARFPCSGPRRQATSAPCR